MLGLILLSLIQAQPAPVPEEPGLTQDEIVVMGERIKRLKLETRRDRKTKAMMCRITRPSGEAELDRLACAAALPCSESAHTMAEFRACFFPRISADAKAWFIARRTARQGGAVPGP
ncbi:hypothetical protein [uncultured Sphingomonas sp.]|uniref:hypothetical protein n=1 Tax=uncultured Sphingomonas sp. TaxID=158754 RepID=UPI0025D4EAF0|nr:hypothetical protein [uncultured Sphingomonas sp.]